LILETLLNRSRNLALVWVGVGLLIAIVAAGLGWGNYRYALQNPGGNDFLVHYIGTRSFLKEGLSPYSDEVALRIQTAAYGRAALPGEHELRVAYPLYSIVFFFPFAMVDDYNLARALWMTVLELALILTTYVTLKLVDWRPSILMQAGVLLFGMIWYHAVRPLINGNAVILIALFIATALWAMKSGADELAGVLFAFSTVKPQLVILLLVFVMWWAYRQRKFRLIGWFAVTIFLLSISATLLLPDWIYQNFIEILRYPKYNPPGTLSAAIAGWWPGVGSRLGIGISVVLSIILLLEWWQARRADFQSFLWTACLTLVISQWIGIQTDPGNFIILFPALILGFKAVEDRWKKLGQWVVIGSMVVLGIGLWVLFINTLQYGYQPQQSTIMFLPLPAFLMILLYWIRWWVVRPPSVWFDVAYSRENPQRK
jgi:hypothetical protein